MGIEPTNLLHVMRRQAQPGHPRQRKSAGRQPCATTRPNCANTGIHARWLPLRLPLAATDSTQALSLSPAQHNQCVV